MASTPRLSGSLAVVVTEPGVRASQRPGPETRALVHTVENGEARPRTDRLVTEEPLEIRINREGETEPLAVTMRTPGNDFELVAGFLFTEGILSDNDALARMAYCVDRELDDQLYNIISVDLGPGASFTADQMHRHFYTTSSCGVCGKASLEALSVRGVEAIPDGPQVSSEVLYSLPATLASRQDVFSSTGGLHAAALFDRDGNLVAVREDVGRHNALDKLIGWAFLHDRLPLRDGIVLVSGRSSFEIVQKCLVGGVPIVAAVSAPSSLAVALAEEFNIMLVGFLRDRRFNVYSTRGRLRTP
jgi:FdhD protein